jgi:hypothetical protein
VATFAAVRARRLMRLDGQYRPFKQGMGPVLNLTWRARLRDLAALKQIAVARGQFCISDLWGGSWQSEWPAAASTPPSAGCSFLSATEDTTTSTASQPWPRKHVGKLPP